jgi:uncharacterized protein (DUF1697 family)
MGQHIALLRGVNVGGKNKIAMPRLKTVLAEAGFSNVRTYINSGNVLFSAPDGDAVVLQQRCRQAILNEFALAIPVACIPVADYADALSQSPEWWDDGSESKHVAIFVIAPANAGDLVRETGLNSRYEKVSNHGQIIFWSAPIKTFSRTKWQHVITASAYNIVTTRNANTTKKLLVLSSQP